MAIETRAPAVAAGASTMSRRDEIAIAFFGTWMVTGLFLDGWAHEANRPETFFSPWHGVLYSGFGAAVAFFTLDGMRSRGQRTGPDDRLVGVGLILFIVAAIGDFVWHEIFGIEADIEALLSPTHLGLMTGGILMVTGPVRSAWRDPSDRASSLRRFAPTLLCLTLATAVASFFAMYLSAFLSVLLDGEEVGIASVLVTNVLLLVPALLVLRRWAPPLGTFTVLFGLVAYAMTGLGQFATLPLVFAAIAGGVAADLVAPRGARFVGVVAPLVLWTAWFAVQWRMWGVPWTVELWTGSIALATLSGLVLGLLAAPPASPRVAA